MTRLLPCVLACALAGTGVSAWASVITLQTRYSTAPAAPSTASVAQMGEYYRNTVEGLVAQTATGGYCNTSLSSFSGVNNGSACRGPNSNVAYLFTVNFGVSANQAGPMSIQVGVDFGRGGAVYLDGNLLAARRNDMWWNGNYNSTTGVFSITNLPVSTGNHVLKIYGLEDCCSGQAAARYRLAGGDWTTFSSSDALRQVTVPEPAGLALSLAALAGLCLTRRATRWRPAVPAVR